MTSSSGHQQQQEATPNKKADAYYEKFIDLTQFRDTNPDAEPTEPSTQSLEKGIKDVSVSEKEADRVAAYQKEFSYIGGPNVLGRNKKQSKTDVNDLHYASPSS